MTAPANNGCIGVDLAGRFRVTDWVAEEVLGTVYRAIDLGERASAPDVNGPRVRVKVLHPHLVANPEKFARFGRELTASQLVRHPNTVAVLGWGEHVGMHFLVFEDVVSQTLQEVLVNGPLAPERAASIAAQVASAVGAAHQEGVIHRNLSPHNVLLLSHAARGDYVKVRDFGLSKLDQSDTDDLATHLTQAGARVGNAQYMAPEYIEEGKVHPKGDMYAVGALLYHMLTGRPPYDGRAADVLTAHVTAPVPAPRDVRPDLPAWCDEVVGALMAKKPKERPGGYQVVKTLEDRVGHPLGPPPLLDPSAPGAAARPKTIGRRPLWVASLLAAAAAVAAIAVGGIALAVGAASWAAWTVAARQEPDPTHAQPAPTPPPDPAPAGSPAAAPANGAPVGAPADPPPAAPGRESPRAPSAAPAPPDDAPPPADAVIVDIRANQRALVHVDGRPVGYTPLQIPLGAGPHEVSAALPGQPTTVQRRDVRVHHGHAVKVDFQF